MSKYLKYIIPVTTLVVGVFAGRLYQLDKPETFNFYPSELSGYYGLDASCEINFQGSQVGKFRLVDHYRIDDVSCRILDSEFKNGWHTLSPSVACTKYVEFSDSGPWHEDHPQYKISFKPAGKDKLTVISSEGLEQLYHRCGWPKVE